MDITKCLSKLDIRPDDVRNGEHRVYTHDKNTGGKRQGLKMALVSLQAPRLLTYADSLAHRRQLQGTS